MKRVVVFLAVCAIALAANSVWVTLATRPAAPRDGGAIFDTPVVAANVRIEGSGPTILLDIEGHFLPFTEDVRTGSLEGCRVDEHVLAAVIWLDEAKASLRIIELYGSKLHECS